jgi:hypothetical protein
VLLHQAEELRRKIREQAAKAASAPRVKGSGLLARLPKPKAEVEAGEG